MQKTKINQNRATIDTFKNILNVNFPLFLCKFIGLFKQQNNVD